MPLGYLLRPTGAINSHQGFLGIPRSYEYAAEYEPARVFRGRRTLVLQADSLAPDDENRPVRAGWVVFRRSRDGAAREQ